MQYQEFTHLLTARRSLGPKMQMAPGPNEEVLLAAAQAAHAAPCHGDKFPVRFVRIVSREKLADAFEALLPADADEAARSKARDKALRGETLIAVVTMKPEDPTNQQAVAETYMTAGGALTNFLNVLFAAGFAAKTVSGRDLPAAEGLLDRSREILTAFVLCGTPTGAPKPRKDTASLLSNW